MAIDRRPPNSPDPKGMPAGEFAWLKKSVLWVSGKTLRQCAVLILCLPIGIGFKFFYNLLITDFLYDNIFPHIDYFASSAQSVQKIHAMALVAWILSTLFCVILMMKTDFDFRYVVLFSFLLGVYAVFYSTLIIVMNRLFPECKGILFGRKLNINENRSHAIFGNISLLLVILLQLSSVFIVADFLDDKRMNLMNRISTHTKMKEE